MKIILLYDLFKETQSHESPDWEQVQHLAYALQLFAEVELLKVTPGETSWLTRLARRDYDKVFPLYGGRKGSLGNEGTLIGVLEWLGVDYIGSSPEVAGLICNKYLTKLTLKGAGLPMTPSWLGPPTQYPVFVKANYGGSSIGISEENLVHNVKEYVTIVNKLSRLGYTQFLSEPYLEGPEYTVGVIGTKLPETLGVMRVDSLYTEQVKHGTDLSFLKMEEDDHAPEIKRMALKIFRTLGMRNYARLDFRYHQGTLYLMEINAIPGMHKTHGDLALCARILDLPYETLVHKIVTLI